jgi:hypothetical protein
MADSPEAGQSSEDKPNAADDTKSRFRAALERKRSEAEARSVRGHGASSSKIHEESRRAGGKRAFRRKSG